MWRQCVTGGARYSEAGENECTVLCSAVELSAGEILKLLLNGLVRELTFCLNMLGGYLFGVLN